VTTDWSARRILKEDGTPISPQYLNDIERDRRNAPIAHILEGLAMELGLSPDVLYFLVGQIPSDIRQRQASVSPEDIVDGFRAPNKTVVWP
jgi:transcriptional regulator with XRE-family HTH domain